MAKIKFSESLETGTHAQLQKLIGDWEGTSKIWFEPGKVHDEAAVSGSIKSILGGRFVMHTYKGTCDGKDMEGIAIMGYHLQSGKFQTAWVDSFHMGTGIMFSEGLNATNPFSVLGHFESEEEDPKAWGWRTAVDSVDDNRLIITAYVIPPGEEEVIATQIEYRRKV